MTAQLEENERQQKTPIGAVMTVTATDGVLQDGQVLQIAEADAGEAKLRRMAAGTNHSSTTIRAHGQEIQRGPTEGLLLRSPIRCTVAASVFHKE